MIKDQEQITAAAEIEDAFPLTRLQAGILFHAASGAGVGVYHNLASFELAAPFASDLLQVSVATIASRHPALRTSFEFVRFSQPLQLVHKSADALVEVNDLRHASRAGQTAARRGWATAERARTFDLGRAPLARFVAHWLGEDHFQLSLSFHHAILDGRSVTVLMTELLQDYLHRLGSPVPPLPPAPPALMARHLMLELEASRDPRQTAFWRERLSGAEPALVGSHAVAAIVPKPQAEARRVPRLLRSKLRALSEVTGASERTLLLVAHLRVVGLLSGTSRPVTGVITHGRPTEAGSDRAAGLFLNVTPLSANLSMTWNDVAQFVRSQEAAQQPFVRFPLAQMRGDRKASELFDSAFNFVDVGRPFEDLSILGLEILDESYDETTNFALMVSPLFDRRGEIVLQITVDRTRVRCSATQITQIFLRALENLIETPGASALAGELAPVEQLDTFNPTPRPQVARDVVVAVNSWGLSRPSAIAVAASGADLTYAEVVVRVERLSARLRGKGVGPEIPVAVMTGRSWELPVAMLAVLHAGGAYVALDPLHPQARRDWILQDSGAVIVLTDATTAAQPLPERCIRLRVDEVSADTSASTCEQRAANDQQLAYVLYTSGSTGRPKGVMVSRGALANTLGAFACAFNLPHGFTLAAVTTAAFDISALELFLPLVVGAGVVLVDADTAADGRRLSALLTARSVAGLQGTPHTWRMLVATDWRPPVGFLALCGGEALPADLAHALLQRGVALYNLYGPTETTIWSTASLAEAGREVTIGAPIHNMACHVLDASGGRVPIGVVGELHIGGPGLARGYKGRSALTAEQFVPDRFGLPGARLYRTGDFAAWGDDGQLRFHGRLDDQIKIRGHRVELAELEACLAVHLDLAEAIAATKTNAAGSARLVAYVRLAPGAPHRTVADLRSELRRFARTCLPEYMLPTDVVVVDAFPRTTNGKIDRKALPAPGATGAESKPPITPVEQRVAQTWRELLQLETLPGRADDFFALGGDSLLCVTMVMRLQRWAAVDIPIAAVFLAPTVSQFASEISRMQASQKANQTESDRLMSVLGGLAADDIEAWLADPLL